MRNPYAPGAGQRPPELAGRDKQLDAFDVVLERIARGRPERSRADRPAWGRQDGAAQRAALGRGPRGWGTGKIEARPEQELRRPLASALHMAVREVAAAHRNPERVDDFLGILKAFALRASADKGMRERWQPGIDVPVVTGRADSGDIEIDLVELLLEAAGLARDVGVGIAIFIDEMQDIGPADVSAICGACHELSQDAAPLIVVGAGLPHLPAVLSASKSYSERLFSYHRIDRLDRASADRALIAPAEREDVKFTDEALDALYTTADGYPYFVQAYGKATWDLAASSPITAEDVRLAAPAAEQELAVGFFGSRYERATPAEREYMRAMAELPATTGRCRPRRSLVNWAANRRRCRPPATV